MNSKRCPKCKVEKLLHHFHKSKKEKDGLQSRCKNCRNNSSGEKRVSNGYCVYEAYYPSGRYIGSGATTDRKSRHLSGNTNIGIKLNEKAYKFNIFLKASKEQCFMVEGELLRFCGLKNILNEVYTNPQSVWWRHCGVCNEFLDKSLFYKMKRRPSSYCIMCTRKQKKEYYHENK